MKKLKIFILFNVTFLIVSCGTIKEGFINQKKNNSDEFLVQKKAPLVMPPNYSNLPTPKIDQVTSDENKIKSLITKSDSEFINLKEQIVIKKSLEKSLLEKIKKD